MATIDPERLRMMYDALPVAAEARVLLVHYGAESRDLALPFAEERIERFDLARIDLDAPDMIPTGLGRDGEGFDLIVLHGVLDHLPGRMGPRRRLARRLLRRLAERLAPQGVMAWSGRNLFEQDRLPQNLRRVLSGGSIRPLGGFGWYRRAARTLGLHGLNIVLVMPDVGNPQALVSAAGPGARSYYRRLYTRYWRNYGIVKKIAARIILAFNLGPFLAPAFLVWGRRC